MHRLFLQPQVQPLQMMQQIAMYFMVICRIFSCVCSILTQAVITGHDSCSKEHLTDLGLGFESIWSSHSVPATVAVIRRLPVLVAEQCKPLVHRTDVST